MDQFFPSRAEKADAAPRTAGPELAVIVPTFNEVSNIAEMVERLGKALEGIRYEIIFVDDDSPDGTADAVRTLAARDARLRIVQRIGRRGLSSAVIEGMMATTAPLAAVIDGDLQHDETRLPLMLERMRADDADLVVGSRYMEGGSTTDWSAGRLRLSRMATWLACRLTGVSLTDPMSGFFMIRTAALRARARDLTGVGYKILLDILSSPGPEMKLVEVPYEFRSRRSGESKLDSRVLLEFVELLIARTLGRWVPTKFVMFALVGALGVVVHMTVLSSLFASALMSFAMAQAVATIVAMTANFFINNIFTYHDRRLHGWQLLRGWLSFAAASAVGALANVSLAVFLFERVGLYWPLAAMAGIVVGAIWNFALTALFTWRVQN